MSQARSSSISSSERRGLARFYAGLSLPLLVCALYFGFATLLLLRSGEYWPMKDIVAKLDETGGRYGTALMQREFFFKQEIYRATRPEVVALGSSRVLGFRQEDFSQPFINLGSLTDLEEVTELAQSLFSESSPPTLVLFGVDFWWFHPQAERPAVARSAEFPQIEAGDLFRPAAWVATGKLGWRHIADILAQKTKDAGISAITQGDGYDRAGAYDYTSILTGARRSLDYRFRGNLAQIKKGERKYAHAGVLSEVQWRKFVALLDFLKKKNIRPVVFIPPLAEAVRKAMEEQGGYGYVAELRRRLKALASSRGLAFFDYHAGGPPGISDCEFVDSHHGGSIVYQRLLLDMATKDVGLRGRLHLAEIGWNIEHFGGRASFLPNETDFLGLGCDKPAK